MNRLKKLEFWLVVVVMVFFIAGISNAAVTGKKYNSVASSLSSQIRKDLNDKSVNVKIVRAGEMQLSKQKQTLFGDAYYVSAKDNEQVPIYFEAIIDTSKNKISIVDYTFLDNDSRVNETFLQKLIIKEIANDYKTQEVAVSLESVKFIDEINNTEKFRGFGEVRIGSLVWKKIKFEINIDADSQKVLYKLSEM